MIDIYLLIGFLGAGKTTLLQSLLESYSDHKIGVIVNEFGEINVDARLVEKDGIEMAELSNGSIFCACIKDKFVDSLIEMSGRDLEYIFIEASGLADPANMAQILDGIKPYTKQPLTLKGSICVVDGKHFLDLVEILPALENQVAYANAVIINKEDLIDKDKLEEIQTVIQDMNPGVHTFVASYCNVDIKEVTERFSVNQKKAAETTNTYESRPSSFILRSEEVISSGGLNDFLKTIADGSFRIKGFAVTEKGPIEVSAVGEEIILTPWHEEVEHTEIVVISSTGMKMLSQIISASNHHLDGKLKLK